MSLRAAAQRPLNSHIHLDLVTFDLIGPTTLRSACYCGEYLLELNALNRFNVSSLVSLLRLSFLLSRSLIYLHIAKVRRKTMKYSTLLSASILLLGTLFITLVTSVPLGSDNTSDKVVRHVKRQCVPNGSFYDDASTKVQLEYIGAWIHLGNQGSTVKSGTLSYTGQANA